MIVTIDAHAHVNEWELPTGGLDRLRSALSVPNPAAVQARKLGMHTDDPPELCYLADEGFGRWRLPRGAVGLLGDVDLDDQTTAGEAMPNVTVGFDLRGYQQAAHAAAMAASDCLIVAPCGAGKTIIGLAIVAARGRSALVLVHTLDLLEQWRERARDVLGATAGIVGGGKREPAALTVATMQTLDKLSDDELFAFCDVFGTVIVDEAHHTPAATLERILSHCRARYRYGLTATPDRTDGLGPVVQWLIGPVLHEIDQAELVADGHLLAPEVVRVDTGWSAEWWAVQTVAEGRARELHPDWSEWRVERACAYAPDSGEAIPGTTMAALESMLVADLDRNDLIVRLVARDVAAGHAVLVLSKRVDHCTEILRMLAEAGVDRAVALTGRVGKRKRAEALDAIRSGKLDVLIATQLADEGLDVPRLDRLVLAAPSRAAGRAIQRLGRIMRTHAGKAAPVLYDLVDDVGVYRSQWQSRRRAYQAALGDVVERVERWGGGRRE